MPVISDTSPVSNLAAIDRLDLLFSLYTEVWIPPAVAVELKRHPQAAALASIKGVLNSGSLRVQELSADAKNVVVDLEGRVDPGEAEAIALAQTLSDTTLLIDERIGRRLAAEREIQFVGLLGMLLLAKRRGLIPGVREIIQLLRTRSSFFISDALEQKILEAAGEGRRE